MQFGMLSHSLPHSFQRRSVKQNSPRRHHGKRTRLQWELVVITTTVLNSISQYVHATVLVLVWLCHNFGRLLRCSLQGGAHFRRHLGCHLGPVRAHACHGKTGLPCHGKTGCRGYSQRWMKSPPRPWKVKSSISRRFAPKSPGVPGPDANGRQNNGRRWGHHLARSPPLRCFVVLGVRIRVG